MNGVTAVTLLQLRYFIRVCACGGFTQAARELRVSQPSVSEAVRSLEDEFGMELLERNSRGVVPTADGEAFRREAERLVEEAEAFERRMLALAGTARTPRLGVPPMLETLVFPSLLASYRRLYPSRSIEAVENGTVTNLEMVRRGLLDAAVASSEDWSPPEGCGALELCRTRLALYLPSRHPLARRESASLAEGAELPLIMLASDTFLSRFVEERCAASGTQPRVIMRTNQLEAIRRMIEEGTAAAFLYEGVLPPSEKIHCLPVRGLPPVSTLLVWKRSGRLTASLRGLLRAAAEAFPDSREAAPLSQKSHNEMIQ